MTRLRKYHHPARWNVGSPDKAEDVVTEIRGLLDENTVSPWTEDTLRTLVEQLEEAEDVPYER